jgi:hypothetical protein
VVPRRNDPPDRASEPDVEISASARAKRLRFRTKPHTDVELHGGVTERGRHSPLETDEGSERRNLPDEVEPGVTYRDISIGWHAAGRLQDEP